MTAVYAAGHWRKRDPLAGLTPAMLNAVADLADTNLSLRAGAYSTEFGGDDLHAPATLVALAARGLAELRFDIRSGERFYRSTRAGRAIAEVIRRRAETRAELSASASRADAGRREKDAAPCASSSPAGFDGARRLFPDGARRLFPA